MKMGKAAITMESHGRWQYNLVVSNTICVKSIQTEILAPLIHVLTKGTSENSLAPSAMDYPERRWMFMNQEASSHQTPTGLAPGL